MKFLHHILFLFLIFSVDCLIRKRKIKFCKLDNLLECAIEPLSYLTSQPNGSGIPLNDMEHEQFCFNIHDYFPYCAKKWLKKCSSPIWEAIIDKVLVKALQDSFGKFCKRNSKDRLEFVQNGLCIVERVKLSPAYRSICIRDLQGSTEMIHEQALNASRSFGKISIDHRSSPLLSFWTNTCCASNRWLQCILGQLSNNCGIKTANIFEKFITHNGLLLLPHLCPMDKYDPNDPIKCNIKTSQASMDYVPKGYQSTSAISYYFSKSCPNVGFGIIKERDF